MGCGNGKVLPDASVKGYVSVVQSLVAFSKARGDDDEPKKKQKPVWFSTGVKNLPAGTSSQQQAVRDERHQDKVIKYKDKFDLRVTAR